MPLQASKIRNLALLLGSAVALTTALPGCAYQGQKLAQLDYQNIAPLSVSVSKVDVQSVFLPSVETSEALKDFTTPPDVALRRYAENRLKARGYEDVLKFTVKDGTVRHSVVDSDSAVAQWAKVGKQDRYDLSIRVDMTLVAADGSKPKDASIELNRYITVPQSYSIARREKLLHDFMQELITEIDKMVTTTLRDRMQLTVSSGDSGPMQNNDNDTVPQGTSQRVPSVQLETLPPPW